MDNPANITDLIRAATNGDREAESVVWESLHHHLRIRARQVLSGDGLAPSLSSGTLVHESYLKLFRSDTPIEIKDRRHFYSLAVLAMRRVMVDEARSRSSVKRGGEARAVPFDEIEERLDGGRLDIDVVLTIGEICEKLGTEYPKLAAVVDHIFFGGLTVNESAELLDISPAMVYKRLKLAGAFIRRELAAQPKGAHAAKG